MWRQDKKIQEDKRECLRILRIANPQLSFLEQCLFNRRPVQRLHEMPKT